MVSLIIPNNGRDLTDLFHSIIKSTYMDYEVIVVDEGKERSIQRNKGATLARGNYFLFLDSDMTISPDLIEECVRLSFYYAGLYIPEIIVNHPIKTWFRSFYNGTCVDAIRFVDRNYFIPFDEDITGFEDWDFTRRFTGAKGITLSPLYHNTNASFLHKRYYMKWLKKYKQKYPNCPELNIWYRLGLICKGMAGRKG